ncbi:Gfo/Idh/MocA family protein [Methylobacterium nonmethylotrophicum]|uniref:Gfo/Idh/MocA family oxidoreductase n=1 Tax=Methylobacterium nonmethylotrophicum TaxID=1141884 RepID=A0A4Z0NJK4_9HYPH|nr:Gfo/Idh/MocA family oxidoreductase [Methylobacterium nonmethylotrophicum]TGD96332.1 Gfo/Idh/MocA family oxidoreductase [Methylobacterium nonmethylotrophicum]
MSSPHSPLRIGLIGAGWVTQHHLAGWARLAGRATVAAIADPSAERREARARDFAIPRHFATAREMFEAGGLDAVDIAAPRAVHAELVRLAADHGLPILCQKPLAPTLAEAQALVAEVEGRVRLMVHENWRFRAYYREAAAWLRAGMIGRPFAARLSVVTSGTLPDAGGRFPALERQPFMRDETRMLVAEVLIHHLDTLRWLLGPLRVTACALGRTCADLAGEDTALIQLAGADGLAVQVFATFAAHGAPPAAADHLEILGPSGAIRLANGDLTMTGRETRAVAYDLDATYSESYAATIAHFVDRLADGAPFETGPADNLETLRLVEACYRLAGREDAR